VKWTILALVLGCLGCAGKMTVRPSDSEGPEKPGGDCYWSIDEGGSECVVEIAGETRRRSPGTADVIEGTQGYGKKKWKCGEKREVCGTEVECTCPFPVTPDGGTHPDGGS